MKYKEAKTEIKAREEKVEHAQKIVSEAKEMVKKYTERVREEKDRSVKEEIEAVIEKENEKIKQTEIIIEGTVERIEFIKKVQSVIELEQKATEERVAANLEKDTSKKSETSTVDIEGASNHVRMTLEEKKVEETKETLK